MKTKLLGEITLKIGSGATPRGGSNSYISSGISLIRSQNVHDFKFSKDGLAFINEDQAEKLNNVSVYEDDVLINITGDSIARTCMVPNEILPARVNQHVSIIRCKPQYNAKYVHYYLIYLKEHLFQICGVGGTRNALTKDALYKLPIKISDQQSQIAKVLSDLDTKIELNNKINAELEAMAKTLYDYWFVQFDFPFDFAQDKADANGKPYKSSGGKMVYNNELKREIPEGWENGIVSDLFDLNPTLSVKKGALSSYIDMNALPTNGFMTKAIQEKEFNGGVKFQNGDVVVARITPCLENGKTGLISSLKENEIGFGSTEFIVMRGKNMPLSCFGAFLSRSELFRKYAIGNMLGTSGRKRVDAKDLAIFPMTIPNKSLLDEFEKIVLPQFKMTTINTKENQQLASLRDWLLPMLMNGQVRVRELGVLRRAQDDSLGMVAEGREKYGE